MANYLISGANGDNVAFTGRQACFVLALNASALVCSRLQCAPLKEVAIPRLAALLTASP